MTVACLEEVGVLTVVGQGLDHTFHGNHYLVTGFIGVLSSIVDNVPLVAGCIGMYPCKRREPLPSTACSGNSWPTVLAWADRY